MPFDGEYFNTDSPITEEYFSLEDVPKNSDALNNRQAGLAALIDNNLDDTPLIQAYQFRRGQAEDDQSHETIRNEVAKKSSEDQKEVLQNLITDFFHQGQVDKAIEGVQATEEISRGIELHQAEKSIEESFVDSVGISIDEKRRQEQLFKLQVSKDVMKLLDEQDLTDKIVNYSGLLLSDVTLDLSRVVESDYLNTPEAVAEFLDTWYSLPVEEKQRLYPALKDAINEATDKNNVKTAFNILRFIDPQFSDDVKKDLLIDQIFLGVDVATLGIFMASRLARLAKAGNILKEAKTVGREDEAAQINASIITDDTGEVAKAAKVDELTAQGNSLPFKLEDILPEATDGINRETQDILKAIELTNGMTYRRLEDLLKGEGFLKETAFTRLQRERIQQKAFKEVEKLKEDAFQQGWDIDDIRITKSDASGFTLEYNYAGVPAKQERTYKLSDIGTFDELPTGAVEKGITSPSFYLKGVTERLVESATNIELSRMKVLDIFNRSVEDIMNNTLGSPLLHKKAYKELDSVLLAGDDYPLPDGTSGRLFNLDELRTGVDTKDFGTVRLNDKQIVAYYGLRNLFDNLGVLKNAELRKTLNLNGFKDIDFEGIRVIGKPFERLQDANNSLRQRRNNVIYDPMANKGLGGVKPLTDLDLGDMYNRGYRVVRFQEPQAAADQFVTHALVKLDNVRQLPLQVMHLKEGYVPKIYKEGFYFVKQELTGTLNGRAKEIVGLKTLRMFNSKKGAQSYMDTLKEENPNTVYRLLHDRELTEVQLADEGVGLSGGLYTSPRAKHPVLFNEEGVQPQRLSAFESLQRNIQHLANYLPRNEWRIGMQQKWINTAREHRMLDGHDFNAALIGEKHTPEWNALSSSREYIRDQIRIPTTEERWFEAKTRSLAEWAENPISLDANQITSKRLPDFARKSLLRFSHNDPFALARSGAFHSLLGWFNPAQLFVQAQGASIAISLFPGQAPAALWKYMTHLRPMMFLQSHNANPQTIRKVSDLLAKVNKGSPDELWEDYQLWQKTGLQESIKATADHAAAAQNFGFGSSAVRKSADKGLVFYREGELFTRGIAFSIAKANWRKANKGAKITDEALKDILDDSMRMMLNLTRANRAAWQKGALSIPTQFLQIQTKFLEQVWPKVLGGKGPLTGAQKARLLAMQFAIYGGAGVPFGNWMINEGAQILGKVPEELDDSLKRYLGGGIWDLLFYQSFGADVELGRRGAIVSGVEDFFKALVYENAPFAEALLGAFGALPTRAFQAMKKIAPLAYSADEIDFTPQELALVASELGTIISTWRNIDKAIYMHRFGMILDKHGNISVDRSLQGGFNPAEIVGRGLGFQLKDVQGTYDIEQLNREWDKHVGKRVDSLINLHYWYIGNVDHPQAGRNLQVMQQTIFGDLNDYEKQRVKEIANKRISNPRNKEERAISKYYNDVAGEVYQLNPFFGGPYTNTVIPGIEEESDGTE